MVFDVAVIGSGPGGYVAAIRAAQLGLKTACIEKEKTLGGTCLNVGCIPSKALLESSYHYTFLTKRAKDFGIYFESPRVDLHQMMRKKHEAVEASTSGIDFLFKKNQIEKIEGKAKFLTPDTLEVTQERGKQTIQARHIIIATGSEPISLPFLPIDEKTIITSTGALALEKIPNEMIVIGGGVIGVEIASIYNRLGSKVTIIEMLEQICTPLDTATSHAFLQILKNQGLNFLLKAKAIESKKEGQKISLKVEHEGKREEISADAILVAIGRKPYTQDLGLEKIGIQLTQKGFLPVDGRFRTIIPSIYAIGDVIEGPMLAHRASEEGVAVAEIIAGHFAQVDYICIPNIIYTHPEVTSIGLTEQEAKAKFDVSMGKCFFKANARARCVGEKEGVVKVLGDRSSGLLLGVHIIGANASEMIGEVVLAMRKRMTVQDLALLPHGHPTLSEAIKEACLDALGRAIHL